MPALRRKVRIRTEDWLYATATWAPGKAQGLQHPWDASRIAAVEVRGYLGRDYSGLR